MNQTPCPHQALLLFRATENNLDVAGEAVATAVAVWSEGNHAFRVCGSSAEGTVTRGGDPLPVPAERDGPLHASCVQRPSGTPLFLRQGATTRPRHGD